MLQYQDVIYGDDKLPFGPFLEEWKEVIGYEKYSVSNYGRVKSFVRNNPKILKGNISFGYFQVALTGINGIFSPGIHRIEGIAFLGLPPSDKHQINHKNGFKTDNFVLNFEWVTNSQNQKHAYRLGLNFSHMKGKFGVDNMFSKNVLQYNLNGDLIKEWDSISLAAKTLKISRTNISEVCTGSNIHRTTAGGFIWKHNKVYNNQKKEIFSKNKKPKMKRTRIQEPKFHAL